MSSPSISLSSPFVEFYIVFYTYDFEKDESISRNIFSSLFYFLRSKFRSKDSRNFSDRWLHSTSPPFIYCGIAFKKDTKLKVFSVNWSGGLCEVERELREPHYSFLTFSTTVFKANHMYNICKSMASEGERRIYSQLKHVPNLFKILHYFGFPVLDYPSSKKTSSWTSAEFVGYVLQQTVLHTKDFHPSYITPTELFLYLCRNPHVVPSRNHPLAQKKRSKEKVICEMSNAINAYRYLCHIPSTLPLPDIDRKKSLAFQHNFNPPMLLSSSSSLAFSAQKPMGNSQECPDVVELHQTEKWEDPRLVRTQLQQ